jgi:molecular chaperone Hsp33
MKNYIIKALAYKKQVRILFLENTEMINEICDHKNINKLLKTALGRTVSVASLISGILKGNQRVSLKVSATDRNFKILADADSMGNVRGYINDELLNAASNCTDNLSIEQLIGEKGCIQVLKDLGMNSLFTGVTDMPYRNIVDDFSYYFKQSEQTTTYFYVNIRYNENNDVILSRGVMAQLLPGAPVSLIDDIREIISENQALMCNLDERKTFEEIAALLFEDLHVLEAEPIQFFCGCSKEIFYPMLYSLNKEELVCAYENNEEVEIVCNVCGKKYRFNQHEIKGII